MGIWSEKSYIPMNNTFQMRSFLRFLERNKLYTAINIFGFAVSLMFVALLTVYIQKEAAVDDSSTKSGFIACNTAAGLTIRPRYRRLSRTACPRSRPLRGFLDSA